jgi:hypothetical protein
MTCKWSINLFSNPNPIYSHSILSDNIYKIPTTIEMGTCENVPHMNIFIDETKLADLPSDSYESKLYS